MGQFQFNIFTGNLDYFESGDGKFVLIAGDTMTGTLTVRPATGDRSITIREDTKLIFDGR